MSSLENSKYHFIHTSNKNGSITKWCFDFKNMQQTFIQNNVTANIFNLRYNENSNTLEWLSSSGKFESYTDLRSFTLDIVKELHESYISYLAEKYLLENTLI